MRNFVITFFGCAEWDFGSVITYAYTYVIIYEFTKAQAALIIFSWFKDYVKL